jgi:3-dehydroquinate synthase
MKKIDIGFLKNFQETCRIVVGRDLVNKIDKIIDWQNYSNIFVITDKKVANLYLKILLSKLPKNTKYIILPSSDIEKNIDNVQRIWTKMLNSGCNRHSLTINLGGGVVSDIGGFAAATYMRGINFVNVSTTLLSDVDASIGGKTGINFLGVKNLIGIFNQPKIVIIDVGMLTTISKRELTSGFAEIIKHGLINDKKYFDIVTSKMPIQFSLYELENIIFKSCQIKSSIVMRDENEKYLRKSLNFGHTVGHAIESLSLELDRTPLLHGESISIGMCVEAKMSYLLGLLPFKQLKIIEKRVEQIGLPTQVPVRMDIKKIIRNMENDKKNDKNGLNFTLLKEIGKVKINQRVSKDIIIEALDYKKYE